MQRRRGARRWATLVAALGLLAPATDVVTSPASGTAPDPEVTASAPTDGYWLAGADGAVYSFGRAGRHGSPPGALRKPIAGAAATPSGAGYWLVGSDGGIFSFGDARFLGSTGHLSLNRPVVAMAATRTGNGYWFAGADGGIFAFGDAPFFGSTGAMTLNKPIVGMAATPTGAGYWLVASDGGIFAFGDAAFHGSTGALRLNKPIVGMAPTPTGGGYWLVASDGGIFAFGDAAFHGSTGAIRLNAPIVSMARTPSGRGYWFAASDGGVFNFGDAPFAGSAGGRPLPRPITAMMAAPGTAAPDASPDPDGAGQPAGGPADPGSTADPASPTTAGPADPAAPPPPPSAPPPPAAPFDVGLIGDTGYSSSQEESLLRIRRHMATFPLAATIHVGDIWAEGHACTDAAYLPVHDVFEGFAAPFVYTPGDNEWTDCSSGSSGALGRIRRIFFSNDLTLGQRSIPVARHPAMPENARWTEGGVVFVTINEPGASGRGGTHRDNNVEWLHQAFDLAEATGAPGVVVGWQDNPFEPSGGRLAKALRERTARFAKPVVLVHGDTHRHRVDHPWGELRNFTRVEVHGDTSSPEWIRMTVDPSSPTVFSFDNERDRS